MTLTEAIALRRSHRTFNGLRLDRITLGRLRDAIGGSRPLLPDADIPFVGIINSDNGTADGQLGTYGFIKGARQFLVMAVGSGVAAHVQAGYMLEQTILEATRLGLSTCWLGGTFHRGPFDQALGPCGDRTVEIVVPVGHVATRMRMSERLMRRIVHADQRRKFDSLFTISPSLSTRLPYSAFTSTLLLDTAVSAATVPSVISAASSSYAESATSPTHDGDEATASTPCDSQRILCATVKALKAVRLAPSSSNSQPWRATVTENPDVTIKVAFTCTTDNRFSAIEMGIAYCHFTSILDESNLPWAIGSTAFLPALTFTVG